MPTKYRIVDRWTDGVLSEAEKADFVSKVGEENVEFMLYPPAALNFEWPPLPICEVTEDWISRDYYGERAIKKIRAVISEA